MRKTTILEYARAATGIALTLATGLTLVLIGATLMDPIARNAARAVTVIVAALYGAEWVLERLVARARRAGHAAHPIDPAVGAIEKGDRIRVTDCYEDGAVLMIEGIAEHRDDYGWYLAGGSFFLSLHVMDQDEDLVAREVKIVRVAPRARQDVPA